MAPPPNSLDAPTSPLLARLLPSPTATSAAGRWLDRASYLMFVAVLAVAIWTFGDYGITWDEWPHISYGDRILAFYTSGFDDHSATTFRTNYFYGGGFDFLGAIFRWFAKPMENYRAIHLFGVLTGVLGIVGTWKLGRRLAGPFAGFTAALLLTLNPVYYGHMFNNPKDLPFAVAYVWSLYYIVAILAELPRPSRRLWVKLAIAVGLAMSVRIAGILLLCYLVLALGLYAAHQGAARRSVDAALYYLESLGLRAALAGAGAWFIMLLSWPWGLLDPLRRPFVALGRMSAYNEHKRRMPFAGEDIMNFDIDWRYLPHYFGYQLPEFIVVGLLLGTVYGVYSLLRYGRQNRYLLAALALLILGMSTWFPPLYAIYKGSVLYDGYRHFLFIVMPMTVLVAMVVDVAAASLARRVGRAAWALAGGVLAVVGVDLMAQMIYLHPQEYTYFNRFIGGVAGAHENYDTDYYGNTFREALVNLADELWRTEPAEYLNTYYYFSGCVSAHTAKKYLPPNFQGHKKRPGKSKHADFYVGYARGHCNRKYSDQPLIASVRRYGVDLNVVRDIRVMEAEKLKRQEERAKRLEEMKGTTEAKETEKPDGFKPGRGFDVSMGPALPPDLAAVRAAEAEAERTMGPALPPELAIARAREKAAGDAARPGDPPAGDKARPTQGSTEAQ